MLPIFRVISPAIVVYRLLSFVLYLRYIALADCLLLFIFFFKTLDVNFERLPELNLQF